MKAMILQYLNELIESKEPSLKKKLKVKLAGLISKCRLGLDVEKELHTKKLIIATIENYIANPNPALQQALREHYKTLEKYLVD